MTMFEYALSMLGTPYVWGGNTVEQGLDCSGYICEVLRAYGHIGREDLTSGQLYKKFSSKTNKSCLLDECESENVLVFFGSDVNSISHVGMFNMYSYTYVESAGEGIVATDKGFVRVRPIDYRSDIVAMVGVEENEMIVRGDK